MTVAIFKTKWHLVCLLVASNKLAVRFDYLLPAPVAQSVECPLRGTGGYEFDPIPKSLKCH